MWKTHVTVSQIDGVFLKEILLKDNIIDYYTFPLKLGRFVGHLLITIEENDVKWKKKRIIGKFLLIVGYL